MEKETLAKELCNKLIKEGKVQVGDVIKHSYTQQIMDGNKKAIEKSDTMITLTTRGDCYGVVVGCAQRGRENGQQIKNNKKEVANCITTVQKDSMVAINDSKLLGGYGTKGSTGQYRTQNRIYDSQAAATTISTGFNPNYAIGGGSMEDSQLRIRKLTPKECFRLMGVRDEDYEKIKKNQSDASLYHLAGDSIVVDVLCAIFSTMIDQ